MKVSQIVRGQIILAGLAAALFFTPAAHSQEITNAVFDDGPNVTTFSQSSVAQSSAPAAVPAQAAVSPVKEAAMAQSSLSTSARPNALIESPWVAAGLTALLLATIALYAIESKHSNANSYSRRPYSSYRGV